ncbi:MAG: hypothetical protein ACE37K_01220 [Planctomycetota bacterium]
MRTQPLTYLIAGILMSLWGLWFAGASLLLAEEMGLAVLVPVWLMLVVVPTVIGGMFVWRSGTLWHIRKAAPKPVAAPARTARTGGGPRRASRSDRLHQLLLIGLLSAGASWIAAETRSGPWTAEPHHLFACGLAAVSILALLGALPRLPQAVRPFVWFVLVLELLVIATLSDGLMWAWGRLTG